MPASRRLPATGSALAVDEGAGGSGYATSSGAILVMSERSNVISPPSRSVTITRSPSKRWLAIDIARCSEKKSSSADAGVAIARATRTKR